MVKMIRDAGLKGYFIGFESGNQRILNFLRKGTTVDRNLEASRVPRVRTGHLGQLHDGYPNRNQGRIMDTVNMIREVDRTTSARRSSRRTPAPIFTTTAWT